MLGENWDTKTVCVCVFVCGGEEGGENRTRETRRGKKKKKK